MFTRTRLCALVLGAETLLVGALAFLAWLTSAWFIDDSLAFRLNSSGWWLIATKRVFIWALLSVLVAGVVLLVNRFLFSPRASLAAGVAAGAVPLLSSVAGGVQFVVQHPFM
jgi:hypothetical protein